MSKCSKENLEKIKANILRTIYDEAPKAISASEIAGIEIRDKEFILRLLREMEKNNLVKDVTSKFSRKSYWTMTEQAYNKYKELL